MSSRSQRFSKPLRLTKASEYQQVFNSAHRSVDKYFLVLARENTQNIARLGLAISKKHLRSAVRRNRIKRLIRESFRQHQQELAGIDIVVLAQKNVWQKNSGILRESLLSHWRKAKKCENSC